MTATEQGYVYQVNISRGGVPKLPVQEAQVTENGVVGDKQRDRRHHGGPTRAVCLYSLDLIQQLQSEGHPIAPGTTGENVTIAGIDWAQLQIGSRLRIGDTLYVEITSHAIPCANITESFADGKFTRISHKLHPGESRLYARILTPGVVKAGDTVEREA